MFDYTLRLALKIYCFELLQCLTQMDMEWADIYACLSLVKIKIFKRLLGM